MAITINAIAGDSAANSYVTLVEADAYIESHEDFGVWDELTIEEKSALLVAATRELDLIKFGGRQLSQTQSLKWPRSNIVNDEGYAVTGIPQLLKAAQFELAMWNLTEEDRLANSFELENFDSIEIGPIKYQTKSGNVQDFPSVVLNRLKAIGPDVIVGGPVKISTKVIVL